MDPGGRARESPKVIRGRTHSRELRRHGEANESTPPAPAQARQAHAWMYNERSLVHRTLTARELRRPGEANKSTPPDPGTSMPCRLSA